MERLIPRVLINIEDKGYAAKIASQLQNIGVYANTNSAVQISEENELFKLRYRIYVSDNIMSERYLGVQNIVLVDNNIQIDGIVYRNNVLYVDRKIGVNSICSLIKFHTEYGGSKKKAEQAATILLTEAGIQPNLKGYGYLKTAIVAVALDPNVFDRGAFTLYKNIANANDVNYSSVERAMRSSVESAYAHCSDKLLKLFRYPIGKPFSSELIAVAADYIRTWVL